MDKLTLRVLQIVPGTSVDGPGLRTSVYLAGCRHACPGCHNPASWDFSAGKEMTVEELLEIIDAHGFNVTLTGGDPLQNPNTDAIAALARGCRERGLSVWCYTGYTFEELSTKPELQELLPLFEAIVDGPFVMSLRSTDLRFRGSSNQRILRPDGAVLLSN